MQKGRWLVIFLCFLAVAINYIDRANLAVAAPYIQKELGLGSGQMGLLLSGFFWTYALMQMPFGWFVDKVGARIALPLAVAWWSLFTAATAAASSLAAMFGCRLMLGVGEAGAYPSCAKIVSQWFDVKERGFATSIFDSGSRVGSALSIPAVASIIGGWIGGLTSDALYRRGWSLTAARKTCIVGGMLMSSSISLSVFTENTYAMLGFFSLAYASLAFAGASIWCLPADVAPTPAHVASIGGIQNFASNTAGIFITTFTGFMLVMGNGSFTAPLMTAGAFALLGAFSYLFIVGKIEPLSITPDQPPASEASNLAQRL